MYFVGIKKYIAIDNYSINAQAIWFQTNSDISRDIFVRGKYSERFLRKEDRIIPNKPFMLYVIWMTIVPFHIYNALEITLNGSHRNIFRSFLIHSSIKQNHTFCHFSSVLSKSRKHILFNAYYYCTSAISTFQEFFYT